MKLFIMFARKLKSFLMAPIIKFRNYRLYRKSLSHLGNLKKIHEGQRCFIIGNGPSLCVEDLEKIGDEICFASHRIYKIFDKTNWRPTYYCAQDYGLINESFREISQMNIDHKYIALVEDVRYKKIKGARYVKIINEEFYPNLPGFSEDISEYVYEGYTVSYMCLQMAIYMGFKEIYLLGVDHFYSRSLLENGQICINKEVKDHFSNEDNLVSVPQLYKSTLSYVAANEYAQNHGVKIYNATRGGALDVFERVNFDTLIKDGGNICVQ